MKRRVLAAAFAVVLAMSSAACGNAPAEEKTTAAPENTELEEFEEAADANPEVKEIMQLDVVLDWYPNAVHSFLYEAIEKGYFEEEGLDVNLISPAESVDAITFVAAGRAQVGLSYPIDAITAYANEDMPVVALGAISQEALGCMASLAESDITADFSSIAGKKFGYSGTGAAKAQIDTITANAGLSPEDFELINVGFDLVTSLTTGSVDIVAGTFINDEIVTMRNAGYDVNVWKYQDYGVPPMYGLIMVTNSELYNAHPEVYEGFLRACRKGFEDMKADEEEVMTLIMEKMSSDDNPLDEVQQRESYRTLLPLMENENADFLSMDGEVWQETIDWMLESGLIEKACTPEDICIASALAE